MSTSCTPQIQFNLTDMVDADTNDPAADEPDADLDVSEYEFLPKVTFREHQLMFYTNGKTNLEGPKIPSDTLALNLLWKVMA